MEINSDEIDKLKKGLNPDNYANNREDIHINEEKDKKNFDANDINSKNNNKKEEKDNIEIEKTEQKNENEK